MSSSVERGLSEHDGPKRPEEVRLHALEALRDFRDAKADYESARQARGAHLRRVQERTSEYADALHERYIGQEGGKNVTVSGRVAILRKRDGNWFKDPLEVEGLQLTTREVQVPRFDPELHEPAEDYLALPVMIIAEDTSGQRFYAQENSSDVTIELEDGLA